MDRVHPDTALAVRFSVARHAAWAPGVESVADWDAWALGERAIGGDTLPALREMPALLRRHAGALGRLACDVAYRALAGAVDVPLVFCSRHGEVARSVELLTQLAHDAPVSPTTFGLSVHSATPGLFSIARRDRANIIGLAAGEASAAHGVIEACGLLADGADQVLLVVADAVMPEVYRAFDDVQPVPYAWAWLLAPADTHALSLAWDTAPAVVTQGAHLRLPAALEVLRFLLRGDVELVHQAGSHRWRWTRNG